MPHKKSALKRMRQDKKRQLRNKSLKSRVKTFMKKVTYAIDNKNIEDANQFYKAFSSSMDKAIKSNVYHKNTVARYKARFMKKIFLLNKEKSA